MMVIMMMMMMIMAEGEKQVVELWNPSRPKEMEAEAWIEIEIAKS